MGMTKIKIAEKISKLVSIPASINNALRGIIAAPANNNAQSAVITKRANIPTIPKNMILKRTMKAFKQPERSEGSLTVFLLVAESFGGGGGNVIFLSSKFKSSDKRVED
jgi:hypothetical protein